MFFSPSARSLLSTRFSLTVLSLNRKHWTPSRPANDDHHHHLLSHPGAFHPGAFHPGAFHPGAFHPGAFLQSVAMESTVSSSSPLRFGDLLSDSNRRRCRDQLKQDDPVDVRRIPWLRGRNVERMKPAAVLVPLCLVDDQPSVLFTLRTHHLPTHKGEVSFPGGKIDKNERAIDAALREVKEEIGLKREAIEVLGTMLPFPGKNYEFLVTPVVGYCGVIDVAKLELNHDEVSEVFSASIESLCCEKNVRYTTYKRKWILSLPIYVGHKHQIWGLTAVVLHSALKIIAPGLYNVEIQTTS